ncbi:hypothetical protein HX004_14200 [Myroides sp. 1354]|uniref:hypothetical protein n=1 Tax=unclassified Myroides TaxID=2642485 RepID=UPI0025771E79|nr:MULTISPECIES: hypothetical protein [unclassified Myroides]MDM1045907.1 hypothetical protein [Myroides sp. R163-1]MDM1056917.1 hypothetical protein [Myroides sp. 1354]MDM1070112.1 hypothetical protein [Myroides sp. 1372]
MKIYEILQISKQHYDEVVLETYIDWCSGFNHSSKAFQLSLSSKALQNYFRKHYSDLEELFVKQIQSYKHLPAKDKNAFYADVTNAIFKNYPSALLPRLKKRELSHSNLN